MTIIASNFSGMNRPKNSVSSDELRIILGAVTGRKTSRPAAEWLWNWQCINENVTSAFRKAEINAMTNVIATEPIIDG